MVGLGISFALGRYHATPWGDNVNDGTVEFAPSEFRLLRALYAVARTNVLLHPCQAAIDEVVRMLALAGPPSYWMPATAPAHTRHYFPSRRHSPSKPGETDRVLDAFLAVSRDDELQVWWGATLDPQLRDALAAAARAVPYLGRSESLCAMRVLDEGARAAPNVVPTTEAPHEVESDAIDLLCVATDAPLDALSMDVVTMRRQRLRQPPGTRFVAYVSSPEQGAPPARPVFARPTLARFRIADSGRPSLREAVALATATRAALQSRYGRRNERRQSACFSGRDGCAPRADQHLHAHYLVTPDREGRRADHIVVWAPEGFDEREVECLATLRAVNHWSFERELRVALTTLGMAPDLELPTLLGPSTRWRSLTPFALPRHPKRRSGRVVDGPEEQIAREWLRRHPHGPELAEIALLAGDWHTFRRSRPGVSRLGAPQLVGAELRFTEDVAGPIALGALSHFGLGVFAPVEGADAPVPITPTISS